jgi:hypothetical protein
LALAIISIKCVFILFHQPIHLYITVGRWWCESVSVGKAPLSSHFTKATDKKKEAAADVYIATKR